MTTLFPSCNDDGNSYCCLPSYSSFSPAWSRCYCYYSLLVYHRHRLELSADSSSSLMTMRTILLWIAGCYEIYAATVEHEDNWKHSIYIYIGRGFYTHLFYLKYTINSFRPIIFPRHE